MEKLNIQTWNEIYSEGRSLLVWPDENIVSSLNRNENKLKKGLDLACGAGRHTILMAQMGIESIGVDSSQSSIQFAKEYSDKLKLKNIKFINEEVQNIDFKKEQFDIVIAWGLIHYLEREDQKEFIKKVYNTLKPGGVFLLTLRSVEDSRRDNGTLIDNNKFLVDYFNEGTKELKQTQMYFWDEKGVRKMLDEFTDLKLGHRVIEPIGRLGNKSAHWLIEAYK